MFNSSINSEGRIPWDKEEALLLFDAYDKLQHHQNKKSEIINALSINLRRRAHDKGLEADATFRNNNGIKMRLYEVEKILHPDKPGLTKTSDLFRATAKLYVQHQHYFLKEIQELDEYRVKILPYLSPFNLLEAVILLDAYLGICLLGRSRIDTACFASAKLRKLAINTGCIIMDKYFRDAGRIVKQLKKIEIAYQNASADIKKVPKIVIEAVNLYRNDNTEYNRLLNYANSIINDAEPVDDVEKSEKTQESHRKAPDVIAAATTTESVDLPRKAQTNDNPDTATTITSPQESGESKFFVWLKAQISEAQYQELYNNRIIVSMILVKKRVLNKPLFMVNSADELRKIARRVAPCFANGKTKHIAFQLVTAYTSFLSEKPTSEPNAEAVSPVEQIPASNNTDEQCYVLHVDNRTFNSSTPAELFVLFCEDMAITYPLKIRSLAGIRIHGSKEIPLKRVPDGHDIKLTTINAYVDAEMQVHKVEDYTRWVCGMCAEKVLNISIDVNRYIPEQAAAPEPDPDVVEAIDTFVEKQPEKKNDPMSDEMEQIVLRADMNGLTYDNLKDSLQIPLTQTKQLVAKSTKIVEIKGMLFHKEAFIDWDEGADELEEIIEKLMQKNSGYISSAQLFEYVRIEMNMFLNDNDMRDERAVYEMAQHLFEKVHYHGKTFLFRGKSHISRVDTAIVSNMDIYKKYAADQGGFFSLSDLTEYLESIGIGTGNIRTQLRMQTEPIFFMYDSDQIVTASALHIDDEWKTSIVESLKILFDDSGDHIILSNIPSIWFDRLPAISGNHPWTPLLLQSILRFYSNELGARTIQALEGQSLDTVHTMLVTNNSPIQNFGDVVISYLLEQDIERRNFEAEELRSLLVNGNIIHGNELIGKMPKALKQDERFAWDISGDRFTIKV